MHYGAETFSTGQWTMRAKSKVIMFKSNNSWILNNHIFIFYYQDCDLRWVGAAFDGRGASSTDWLLLRRVTKDMCSSRKSPRKLRSGKSLDFSEEDEEDDRYRLIMNWNKSIKMSEYKNKTAEIINNKPMFKEDKNYLFWHPMHTFLKVPTSSSVKCAIAQLYPANWLFSHPALCLPVLMNVDVVADSASGLGRPLQPCTARWSVCGVYYCRTGSVLYTFSSNTTRVSSSVHGDMGTQKL